MRVHQVRIDFNVTEEIVRYVYVYIVEAQNCYLIDSASMDVRRLFVISSDRLEGS